ncbi:MAG: serine hydrolase domain-containing protein [Steroidobacteraceae bacterium]
MILRDFRLALAVSVLVSFPGLSAAAADLTNTAALESFVDGVVEPTMSANKSPSGVVVIAKDGQVILAKGYGYKDVATAEPVDPQTTLFRPGSVSKLFTWMAVMQLVDQGKLDLDADVNGYLKKVRIKEAFGKPVTLRHIMTHTAGFEDGALGYLIVDDPGRIMPLADSMERYQPKRVNAPGTHTAYSNYATSIAGLIVADISGLSFNEYIKTQILQPLGMQHATFDEPLPATLAADMAKSYTVETGGFVEKPFEIVSNFGPAGALSASGTDMVRFAQAVLNGGELDGNRIIGEATLATMLTRAFSHDPRLMGMALGFYEEEHNGTRLVGHGGDTQWFHSYLGIDQTHNLAFFVSFGAPGGSAVRSAFTPALYNEYFPAAVTRPVPPKDFAKTAQRYAGNYGFWRNNFSSIEKLLGLGSVMQVAPTKDDTLVLAFAGNAKQYVQVDKNLFVELDPNISLVAGISPQRLAFQEDASGTITGFVLDGLPFMSLRKLPLAATPNFNFSLLGASLLVFVLVLLRRFFQRKAIKAQVPNDRAATSAAVWAAAANLLVVVAGLVVVLIVKDKLFTGIPFLFKAWLVLPVLATIAGIYLLYRTVLVWRNARLGGFWARVRYSVIALCALFMCWFYWYWNVLGFQYKT